MDETNKGSDSTLLNQSQYKKTNSQNWHGNKSTTSNHQAKGGSAANNKFAQIDFNEIKREEDEAEEQARQGDFLKALNKFEKILELRRGAQGAQSIEVSTLSLSPHSVHPGLHSHVQHRKPALVEPDEIRRLERSFELAEAMRTPL